MSSIRLRAIMTFKLAILLWSLRFNQCLLQEPSLITQDVVRGEQVRSINNKAGQCKVHFKECVTTYFGYFEDFQKNYTKGSPIFVDAEGIDQMCKLSDSLETCFKNIREMCKSETYWGLQRVHYYTTLLTYICSPEGIRDFLKTNGSVCNQNILIDKLQVQCERSTHKSFQLEKELNTERSRQQSYYCLFLQEYRQCSVQAVKQSCGAALAQFMSQIDEAMNKERYDLDKKMYNC